MNDKNINIKRYEIPIEGKITIMGFDLLDVMKQVENQLQVVPMSFKLKPKLEHVEITELITEEE